MSISLKETIKLLEWTLKKEFEKPRYELVIEAKDDKDSTPAHMTVFLAVKSDHLCFDISVSFHSSVNTSIEVAANHLAATSYILACAMRAQAIVANRTWPKEEFNELED